MNRNDIIKLASGIGVVSLHLIEYFLYVDEPVFEILGFSD